MLPSSSLQSNIAHKKKGLSSQSERAVAHLKLEGITPSSALLKDMELLDAGKISHDEFVQRGIARAISEK